MADTPWSQFKNEKTESSETWRSGSQWACCDEYDVFWMTVFCLPCQIGREWNAAKTLQTYSTNWPICLLTLFCGCTSCCVVGNLRTSVRKIGDSSVSHSNPESWIPGMSFCTGLLLYFIGGLPWLPLKESGSGFCPETPRVKKKEVVGYQIRKRENEYKYQLREA
ncbi:hypothetical protein DIPPA_10995 [Diplonema papillatum]|nr:hypothetical protein DIPPA_10995 [Diplonema papillatum]